MSETNTVNGGGGNGLYPPLEPFSAQSLSVSPVHRLYVEQSGIATGFPVLFLHGGPGSQTRPEHRRYFDPSFYHVVLFDQRGCGRSNPFGSTEQNTTWHLVEDIEAIRYKLGVDKWLLFGGSWGSTLALAYAMSHPGRVAGMILRGVFLASRPELEWYINGLRSFIPTAWQRLTGGIGEDVIQRYQGEVNHADQAVALGAARRWVEYENSVMAIGGPAAPEASAAPGSSAAQGSSTGPGAGVNERALLARARVQLHYLAAECFLREGELMQAASAVTAPTIIVQGRTDMVCPPVTAYELSARLPAARLRMIEQAGHAAQGPRLAHALRIATDDMRKEVARA
ncbi:MAG: alpha/beta fold hydrolase [Betaproteobacteria bacterium]|nr:MAG: alpha/beta fold hydrolase [Betaproteobacteria bacterium]